NRGKISTMAHEVFVILPETRDGLSARGRTAGGRGVTGFMRARTRPAGRGKGCDRGSCAPARGETAGAEEMATRVHARPHVGGRRPRGKWPGAARLCGRGLFKLPVVQHGGNEHDKA